MNRAIVACLLPWFLTGCFAVKAARQVTGVALSPVHALVWGRHEKSSPSESGGASEEPDTSRQVRTNIETIAAHFALRPLDPGLGHQTSTVESENLAAVGTSQSEVGIDALIYRDSLTAYKEWRYEDCIHMCRRLLESRTATTDQRVRALILAGASCTLLKREDAALIYFRELTRIAPHVQLDQLIFPDSVLKAFDAVTQRSLAHVPPAGRLKE